LRSLKCFAFTSLSGIWRFYTIFAQTKADESLRDRPPDSCIP
jgi:hypothetical protein